MRRITPWFVQRSPVERRRVEFRLQRVSFEAEKQHESLIQRWLDLGTEALAFPPEDDEHVDAAGAA
jgi:hypothetical protein